MILARFDRAAVRRRLTTATTFFAIAATAVVWILWQWRAGSLPVGSTGKYAVAVIASIGAIACLLPRIIDLLHVTTKFDEWRGVCLEEVGGSIIYNWSKRISIPVGGLSSASRSAPDRVMGTPEFLVLAKKDGGGVRVRADVLDRPAADLAANIQHLIDHAEDMTT